MTETTVSLHKNAFKIFKYLGLLLSDILERPSKDQPSTIEKGQSSNSSQGLVVNAHSGGPFIHVWRFFTLLLGLNMFFEFGQLLRFDGGRVTTGGVSIWFIESLIGLKLSILFYSKRSAICKFLQEWDSVEREFGKHNVTCNVIKIN